MKTATRTAILVQIIVGCAVMTAAGCNSGTPTAPASGPKSPTPNAVSTGSPAAPSVVPAKNDLPSDTPAFTVTAQDFYDEYQKDEKSFAAKYADKLVEVTGDVYSVAWKDSDNAAMILLNLKGNQVFLCISNDPEPWAKILGGQKVTLRGVYPKEAFSFHLGKCDITNPGTYLGVPVPLDQLLKETTEMRDQTRKKYDKKWLVVESEVATLDENTG